MFARFDVPQTDSRVFAPTSDDVAIGTERNAIDPTGMPAMRAQVFARFGIPQPDSTVPTPACERASIRAERNAPDPTRMPSEECDLLVGYRIVQPDTDTASRCKSCAVGRILNFV